MLELVFLIIKSVVLVPVMLIAALVNSALCSIGLSFACQDLSYNLEILRSSAIVVGILVVAAPTLYFLITKPDRVAGRIERFIVRFPHQVVHFLAWLHYVFVPHPAEGPIRKAQRSGSSPATKIDEEELAARMEPHVDEQDLPPVYKSDSQRRRAEEVRRLLEEETKIFDAAEARERARQRMERAKRGEG